MLSVFADTWLRHDHRLLLLATLIWVAGSLSLFLLLQYSLEFGKRRRQQWAAISVTTGGIGVWGTHFVAMLGHRGAMSMSFDVGLTILSIVEVIFCFRLALGIFTPDSTWRQILAGLVSTVGVALMHFTGMAAMGAKVSLQYDVARVAWALGLSSVCFALAFIAFARTRGARQIALPALFAFLSVWALHFIVMSGTRMTMVGVPRTGHVALSPGWLIVAVTVATVLLIVATAGAMLLHRYLTDLRGLADATLEGLAIVQGERIVEVNTRFGRMLGMESRALLGQNPGKWLTAADGRDLLVDRDLPVEAMLASPGDVPRIFEIATREIEYRGRESRVVALRDLTEKKAAQRRIEHMACHDPLTDLANRSLLDERLTRDLALAQRNEQPVALIALDLDRFKAVNDIFGHAAGDEVLCRVAAILTRAAQSTDTVARVGGDEFIILQVGVSQPEGARTLIRRISEDLSEEMNTARDPTAVGVSVGVAIFPDDAGDAATLRHGADVALYRAKQSGRGTICFFDQQMDAVISERRMLEHDLRHAMVRRQMHIAFQPLVNTRDRKVFGYEALVRWDHPDRGQIPPSDFVPIAEETGSIVQLGEWVLREACAIAVHWDSALFLAVNVSAVQFQVPGLAASVEQILEETGFPAHRLELEITESVLMKDREGALETLNRLKAHGVRIVMDDFGTGYSSLSNLQSFSFDKIKIDRSFVGAMDNDVAARSIIRAIVGIGRSLALPVVAEGVETEEQLRMVIEEGCPQAQGYLFGRPQRLDSSKDGEAALA